MMLYDFLINPFAEFIFMRRALVGCIALSLSCAPIGVFLVLRRMSLMGDALSHAVLPGAAIGFIIGGLSLPALALGGMAAGLLVALLAGITSHYTRLNEDASFAGFYLLSLAVGVLLISIWGSSVDLTHILFGSVLAVDTLSLILVASVTTLTFLWFAYCYRGFVLECVDTLFLAATTGKSLRYHLGFIFLTVLNLVAGFQALGTLMAVGLMMLPAASARLIADSLGGTLGTAILLALLSSIGGLILSFQFDVPSGPAIIVFAGLIYVLALLFAPKGWLGRRRSKHHLRG
jgi:zinc/manganese transport system permease protein